jgi:hypothetical protein
MQQLLLPKEWEFSHGFCIVCKCGAKARLQDYYVYQKLVFRKAICPACNNTKTIELKDGEWL